MIEEDVQPKAGQGETTKGNENHNEMLERLQEMENKNKERLQQHAAENKLMKERIGIIEKIQRRTLSTLEGQEAVIETIRVDINSIVQSIANLVGEVQELKSGKTTRITNSTEKVTPQWEDKELKDL